MVQGKAASSQNCYDGLGWFYNRYWSGLAQRFLPALDHLLLRHLDRRDSILDLCCGAGHLSAALTRRGLFVTGIDASAEMLTYARTNAPTATFTQACATSFKLSHPVRAIVSTGDSLNHLLTPDQLARCFQSAFTALAPAGRFVFDLNLSKAFETQWHKSSTIVSPDHLLHIRGRYNRLTRIGSTEITPFENGNSWRRIDITLEERCYSQREVRQLLAAAGFTQIRVHSAETLGVRGRLGIGRAFFSARKPED